MTNGEEQASLAALARNDAYLRVFVEALGMCPYAKRCREAGKLHRRVLLEKGGAKGSEGFAAAVSAAANAVAEIEGLPPESVEVGLLIFPSLEPAPGGGLEAARAFEQLWAAVRERITASSFYCVAFHPALPEDVADEHRAVAFIRRTPDPTLQLVRKSVLNAVRGEQGSIFLDPTHLSPAELMAVTTPLSISDRIARANLDTLRREGLDHVRALLNSLHPCD